MTLQELVKSHGDQNDGTAFPFWIIASKAGLGKIAIESSGFWFNREDAERFLKATRYRFPKTAFVYCMSGHDSWHVKELYALANAPAEERGA